jgi:hypothetical protein
VVPEVAVRGTILVVSLVATCAGDAAGQARYAALVGQVRDPTGAPVEGARLTATMAATGLERATTTDGHGRYALENLPPGEYDITARRAGMRPSMVKGQLLFVATTRTLNVEMGLPGLAEEIVVDAARTPLVETASSEMGQVVRRSDVDELPVVDRTFTSLALLTPTVQQDLRATGLSVAGQRGFNNNILVDGVTNRSSARGDQLMAFSQDWIGEFRVSAAGYAAEFGNASGGVINVVTRSGGNDFHGRAFVFVRDDALDAAPALTAGKSQLSEVRPGGYVSGPISRDKAFFFAGFERLDADREATVTSPLEACAPPSRIDAGSRNCLVPAGSDQTLLLLKADWRPRPADGITLRYNRQRTGDFNAGVGGLSTVEHGRSNDDAYRGLAASWTHAFGATAINDLRAVSNRARPEGRVNAGRTFEIVRPSGLLGAPPNHGVVGEEWLQVADDLTVVSGAHTAKLGVTYSRVRFFGAFRNLRDGQYTFATDRPLDLADPETHPLQFVILEGGTDWDERASLFGAFAQDRWRIAPRVTLNYGIRYDSDDSLAISGARRVHTVSPRAGIAWALDGQARSVLRASAGAYHDSEHTNLANIFILNNLLLERAVVLHGNPAFGAVFNPFFDPADPGGSAAALRRYLAEAFIKGRTPDLQADSIRGLARTVNGIDPDFTVPVNRQFSVGMSRELGRGMAVSADFVHSRAKSLLVWRERNLSPQGQAIDPSFGSKVFAGSVGSATYRALALRYDLHLGTAHAGLSYTWARCEDDTSSTLGGTTATNPFDMGADAGPCDVDVRHSVVARGGARLPLGFEVSSIVTARSAHPYSAITSAPLPLFARFEPRNRRRGDGYMSVDVRLGRTTVIAQHVSASVFVEAFNLLDRSNVAAYVANVSSPQFGDPSEALAPRRLQLGLRLDF